MDKVGYYRKVYKQGNKITMLRRKGKWIESEIPGERFICSICGGGVWYYDTNGYVEKSAFCPNCGAKMVELKE